MDWCGTCRGRGELTVEHDVRLRIPAGVQTGARFRFSVTPQDSPPTFVEVRIRIV